MSGNGDEKFTFEAPAVNADEFLRGSPLELAHQLARKHSPSADHVYDEDRPGDPR